MQMTARAGEVILKIGIRAQTVRLGKRKEGDEVEEVDVKEAMQVAKACRSVGGVLEAVGQIIETLVSNQILKAKYVRTLPVLLICR